MVARVHAGSRRSEREGLESRGKSSWMWVVIVLFRRSFAGSRGCVYCLRGGKAIEAWGHAGPARVPRAHARPTALAAPCGSIPSGSDVAQLCGAGPRGF